MAPDRVYNFSAGPSQLPLEVLSQLKDEMFSYQGTGMNVMEMSHRSKQFLEINKQAEADLRDILSIPSSHKVIFMQGGATLQFSAIPLNLFGAGKTHADY